MIPTDTLYQRLLVGIFVALVLMGAYAFYDRGRTLECRLQAQTTGMTAVDSVALCKK